MSAAYPMAILASLALISAHAPALAGRKIPNGPVPAADWKSVVTQRDMERIRNWRTAFVKAVETARARGNAQSMAFEGELLDPDASRGGDPPPPGQYHCRTIKLGGGANAPAYMVYPNLMCRIADQGVVKGFANESRMQRVTGWIFKGDEHRSIFLGTMAIGDEKRAMDYGRDSYRDMAGAVERIGPQRWRMILPYPGPASVMDVIELVPVAPS